MTAHQPATPGDSGVRVVRAADAPTTQMKIPEKGYSRHLISPDHGARNVHELISVLYAGAPTAPYHYHEHSEAIYHVLSGEVEVVVEDRRYRLRPDDVAFIPAKVPHAAGNPGSVDAEVLGIYAPSPWGDFHVVDMPEHIEDAEIPAAEEA